MLKKKTTAMCSQSLLMSLSVIATAIHLSSGYVVFSFSFDSLINVLSEVGRRVVSDEDKEAECIYGDSTRINNTVQLQVV